MSCACIRNHYNFHVDVLDNENIVYQDLSLWMDETGYSIPTTYNLSIIPPTSSKEINIEIGTQTSNKLGANIFGGKLKDGIYCFKTTSCGIDYQKSVALFPNTSCCLKQAWATLDESKYEQLREIENHLKIVSINAGYNNVIEASKNLKIAEKLLENLKCNCDC